MRRAKFLKMVFCGYALSIMLAGVSFAVSRGTVSFEGNVRTLDLRPPPEPTPTPDVFEDSSESTYEPGEPSVALDDAEALLELFDEASEPNSEWDE